MKNTIKKIFEIISKRKKLFGIIALILIVSGYFGFKTIDGNNGEVRYVLASVEKGTLVTSVSGTGQVSASNQVDLKAKTAGEVLNAAVKNGQEVKKGDLIAQLDYSDASKDVRDAEIALELAKLSLKQASISDKNDESELEKAYEQGFNAVVGAFQDFSIVMSGLEDILFDDDVNGQSWNLDAFEINREIDPLRENDIYYQSYQKAKLSYESTLTEYKSKSRVSDKREIELLIEDSYKTAKDISECSKNITNLVQSYKDYLKKQNKSINPNIDIYISDLNSHTNKANNQVVNLFSAKQTIETKSNSDSLTVQTKTFDVEQKENSLLDAKEKLADCSVRSSIDGVIAQIDIEKGDNVSLNDSLATIITKQRTAEISLNEVDVSKVKVGQKATLTFDAVENLSITGEVAEVDAIGAVSQGVVSYNVKIVFDTQDNRIKPGMSASASIITDVKQDVLMVPNSAVKTLNNSIYVDIPSEEIFSNTAASVNGIKLNSSLKQQVIETGLTNDSYTEVVSGLNEGDQIISRTINGSSSKETTSNLFQAGGGKSSGGVRISR